MGSFHLPFDTVPYDDLPVSVMIYQPVRAEGGGMDFRLVYANKIFAADWADTYGDSEYLGALLRESTLMDEDTLETLERFADGTPQPFSAYIPMVRMFLHFQPITGLPEGYCGFLITNLTDCEEKESKMHFLRTISQLKTNAILLRQDAAGRLESVYVSESFAKMMECGVEEALRMMDGVSFFRYIYPEDRAFVRSILKRRVAVDGSTDLTIQQITAKGSRKWVSVHFAFIDDFHEHFIYCTYADVTVLKSYEERLRSVYVGLGNNFYQATARTLAMFRVNLAKNVIEEAKGRDLYSADSTSYPFSEAIRRRSENFPIPEERERFLRTFDRERLSAGYLEGQVSASELLYCRRADGRACFVRYTATMTRHPISGDMIAFIREDECNGEKVRETLMSKILVRQFDMVAYLVDGNYGVTIGDGARITRGSIFPTTRSGAYKQYLENQVLPVLTGTEEERRERMEALSLETVARETRRWEPYMVNIVIEIDGEVYHKRFDFYSVDSDADFYIVLKSDTTALHREQEARNEQLRLALAEARQANTAKTAFLSSMSHEIRTPMNAIIGLDSIALKEPDLSPRTREHLEKIGGSAQHLLQLINDILDMSRIESGRMVLKNEEFSVREILDQISVMIHSQCQERGQEYRCEIGDGLDGLFYGDDMKLKQVLLNILGNAVKFTPAGGSVSLKAERTAAFGDQSTLRFTVRDTGIGMDAAFLPKIFDAFSQEDATTTNRYGGSGLGMAITKNIVEMMNGSITVESEKGKGSVFTVNVTLQDAGPREQAPEGEIRVQELRVLVIDDDAVACEHARLTLSEAGITADTCLSGAEALELLKVRHARQESYNLIFVDMRMPEMNGVELSRKIRELYNGESAIIILTAYSWEDVVDDAVEAGVDGFMSKPVSPSTILDTIRKVLARKREQAPKEKEPADLTGRRILVAEDMAINAEILIELLEMMDMTAEHAENGQIAVDMFSEHPEGYYDAVLMDMRMPVMDGLTATKTIRALPRADAKKIPIIALTANAFDEDVQRSLQAGLNAHLSKPVEPEVLFKTLGALIED